MRGKRTAIILGAGASYCYEDGNGPLPLQKDLVGRLGGISVSSGEGAPEFVGPAGLSHSPELAEMLKGHYGISEDASPGANRLAFWDELRRRGKSLETVYAEMEQSLPADKQYILADFAAILRTSVKLPIPVREPTAACRHHRRLAEVLEPGDYIINFNWDSLMADALLYSCPFWYPRSGFGPWRLAAITAVRPKSFALQSLVHLYHIHGSVLLYEMLEDGPDSRGSRNLLYLGPPGYSEINSLASLLGFSPDNSQPRRSTSDPEQWAVSHGYLHCEGRWFKPLFVPPSTEKGEYRHWYHRCLRTAIHTVLPTTQTIFAIGYSFPSADIDRLSGIFVPGVMQADAEVIAVNPACPDSAFQACVRRVFSSVQKFDFNTTDFKAFSAGLEDKGWRVFA